MPMTSAHTEKGKTMSEVIVRLKDRHIKVKGGEYVQEIVRCQECKYWDNEDDAQRCSYAHNGLHWAKPNDFCSYGERSE